MTPEQIKLINSSFATINYTREQSAKIFYDRLFVLAPEARRLFTADLDSQGKKLMDTLAIAVTAARNPESLKLLLEDTAKRHVQYGATGHYYTLVGEALLWTLEQQLGRDFTPALSAAWSELYKHIADAMQEIAHDHGATE